MKKATQIPIWKDKYIPWKIREQAFMDAGVDPAIDDDLMDEICDMIREVRQEMFDDSWIFDEENNYWKYTGYSMYGFVHNDSIIIPVENGNYLVTRISKLAEEEKTASKTLHQLQSLLNFATA
ncbi:MAG: hypothetical protein FWG64_08110 [Firmicutes bacterium]|nr:hypothetical protein [Bacillota bacterium]